MPEALVITTAGTNCDVELAQAFELAGARSERVHLNALRRDPSLIDRFDLIGVPGGFSYGDAVAAGRIAAQLIRQSLYGALVRAIERGVAIIAPCNGFQTLVQAGLLPGPPPAGPAEINRWPEQPSPPIVALAPNQAARFADRWTRIEVPRNTRCIWTRDLVMAEDASMLPSAHGEGRFIAESVELLADLERRGQIALRYALEENFNGSMGAVAGICDASGLVFGLMPHPERYTRWTQHPFWTRLESSVKRGDTPGLQMFRKAVEHAIAVGAS